MILINKLDQWLLRIEEWILLILTMFMVFLAFTQVVLRNFFDLGILWGDVLLRHLVLWIGFMGASIATKENKHINIDVLKRLIKGAGRKWIQFITEVCAALITIILALAAWKFVRQEREFGTVLFGDLPVWYFQIIIPVGFFLIAVRFLISGLNSLHNSKQRRSN